MARLLHRSKKRLSDSLERMQLDPSEGQDVVRDPLLRLGHGDDRVETLEILNELVHQSWRREEALAILERRLQHPVQD